MALIDNLVSYWKLDETSGNRADSHGSNTLVDNNSTPSGTGKINNAADSNGSDDYLRAADHSSLDITGDITINFWINSGTGTKSHFGKWDDGSSKSYLLQIFSDDIIYWVFSNTGSDTLYRSSNSTVSRSGWHMMSGTYVASTQTAKIYYDGSEVAGTNSGSLPTTIFSSTSGFGNRYFGASFQYSQGLQDEVGLWSRALSASEIGELYNSGNGLAYPFTSNTHDASGKLLFAGAITVTGQVSFFPSGSLIFNGVATPNTSVFVFPVGQILFNGVATPNTSVFVFPVGQIFFNGVATDLSTLDGLIAIGDGTVDQAIVLASNSDTGPTLIGFGYYSSHGGGGNAHGSAGSIPSTGQYYHLTLTRDGNAIKFYVNGNLIDNVSLSGQTAAYGATPVVNIGRRIADYFNGRIDDVRVYSRALPQINVTSLSQGDDLSNASFSIGVVGGSTGLLRFSGQATTTFTPNYNMIGSLFITGDATEDFVSTYETSGLLRISGIASTALNFYIQPIGRLTVSGLATPATSVTFAASGTPLRFTGIATQQVSITYLASGLLRFTGLATITASFSYQPFGVLIISGAATYQTFVIFNASGSPLRFIGLAHAFSGKETDAMGGLVISGQGVFTATYFYLTSGQLRFSGDMGVSAVSYEASGVLLLLGTVPFQRVYVFSPSGKLLLYEPTLLAWWRLNEGTGGLAGDSSGYNKTGSLFNMENGDWVGGAPFLPSNPYSLSFDGIEEYVSADFSHGEGITEFTISLWTNASSLPPAPGGMGMTMTDFLLDALDAELFLLENEPEYTITFAVPKPQVND